MMFLPTKSLLSFIQITTTIVNIITTRCHCSTISTTTAAATTTTTQINTVIDLSHQFHKPSPQRLLAALDSYYFDDDDDDKTITNDDNNNINNNTTNATTISDTNENLYVDISSTSLSDDDDDMTELATAVRLLLEPSRKKERKVVRRNGTIRLHLAMRRNDVTFRGLDTFFKSLDDDDDGKQTVTTTTDDDDNHSGRRPHLSSLDVSFNNLNGAYDKDHDDDDDDNVIAASSSSSAFSVFSRILSSSYCPERLDLSHCDIDSITCRHLEKAFRHLDKNTPRRQQQRLKHLHLAGNPIGDSGFIQLTKNALSPSTSSPSFLSSLTTLDLSRTSLTNVGLQWLAHQAAAASATSSSKNDNDDDNNIIRLPRRLNLSLNTDITHEGIVPLTRRGGLFEVSGVTSLDLCGMKKLGDEGAAAVADLMVRRRRRRVMTNDGTSSLIGSSLRTVTLRGISMGVEGAEVWGKALASILFRHRDHDDVDDDNHDCCDERNDNDNNEMMIEVDLSGNPIGVYTSPSLSKKGTNKTKKTAEKYMSYFGDKLKTAAGGVLSSSTVKKWGLVSSFVPVGTTTTVESDDDIEDEAAAAWMRKEAMSLESENDARHGAKRPRCGAKALADAIIDAAAAHTSRTMTSTPRRRCLLGLRQCALDKRAVEALAMAKLRCRDRGVDLIVDVESNEDLDDDTIMALQRDDDMTKNDDDNNDYENVLEELAKVYAEERRVREVAIQKAKEMSERAVAEARLSAVHWNEYDDDYDDEGEEEDYDEEEDGDGEDEIYDEGEEYDFEDEYD